MRGCWLKNLFILLICGRILLGFLLCVFMQLAHFILIFSQYSPDQESTAAP